METMEAFVLWLLFSATCEACDHHNEFTSKWPGVVVIEAWHPNDPRWTPLDAYMRWYDDTMDPWGQHGDDTSAPEGLS